MRPWCDAETSVLDRSIFERVPECQTASRVREVGASVLVWNDAAADTREFGNELTLCDTRVSATERFCDEPMAWRVS